MTAAVIASITSLAVLSRPRDYHDPVRSDYCCYYLYCYYYLYYYYFYYDYDYYYYYFYLSLKLKRGQK